MLRPFVDETGAQLFRHFVDVDSLEQLTNSGGTDVGEERVVAFVLGLLPEIEILVFGEKRVILDRPARTIGDRHVLWYRLLLACVDDDIIRVVDDLLEIAQSQIDEIPHWTRKSLEEPDVGDGHGELDVTHALATDAAQGYFDAAAIADHTAITDALVLAAVAFPVLDRAKAPLAEQAILLRLERAVVDRLGLQNLAPRPPGAEAGHLQPLALLGILRAAHLFGRCDADLDVIE